MHNLSAICLQFVGLKTFVNLVLAPSSRADKYHPTLLDRLCTYYKIVTQHLLNAMLDGMEDHLATYYRTNSYTSVFNLVKQGSYCSCYRWWLKPVCGDKCVSLSQVQSNLFRSPLSFELRVDAFIRSNHKHVIVVRQFDAWYPVSQWIFSYPKGPNLGSRIPNT